jgi:hypothetical protein
VTVVVPEEPPPIGRVKARLTAVAVSSFPARQLAGIVGVAATLVAA